jgi:hypothetical protein
MLVTKKPDAQGNERVIMTESGTKTQSVNFCTLAGVQGKYEGWVYFKPAFFVDAAWFATYPTYEATLEALRERSYRQLN